MKPVTTKELEMLTYIRSFAIQKGYLPTIREIADGVGLKSTSTVHFRMERLSDLGYIERIESGKSGVGSRYRVKGLRYTDDSQF